MATESHETADGSSTTQTGLTWHRLLFFAVAGISGMFLLLMAVFLFFDPFLATFVVIFGLAAFLVRRGGRGPVIFALVLGILFLLLNFPFLVPPLAQPASIPDFVPAVLSLILDILVVVSAIMILRGRAEPSPGPRTAVRVAGAVFVVAAALSVVAIVTYDDASPQEGDVRLVTQDTEYQDGSLQADAGSLGVFIENKDQTLHTFTIDKLDVDLAVPAGASARVEFDAQPGEYTYYCVPHEGLMEGTLTVE